MHKTFLSYHHAKEQDLKDSIIETYGGESFIDKSVSDGDISTDVSEEYIMRKIREEYLADTTVTVVLIGRETAQRPFVNSEIQASLWGENPAGLIGVVRDEIWNEVFTDAVCSDFRCNCGVSLRQISTGYTLYLPYLVQGNHRFQKTVPHYTDEEVYCAVVRYSDFIADCEKYIDEAFNKRAIMNPAVKRNADTVPAIRAKLRLW
ncbi:TIR domain-containing protein [Enterobacter roggenkampii]|uniref:TIR domain-containing protein n=1 Tax=Enterobacter roggenkampii TaxID=1812935 RepID=UPI002A7FF913|nr:TIR domain-containing protein [Enterobacter roggenkampii]